MVTSIIGQTTDQWVVGLIDVLRKEYTMDRVEGPHDWTHPHRMVGIGRALLIPLSFDWAEFQAAVWLHNVDRMREETSIGARVRQIGFEGICRQYLDDTPFDPQARERIIDAVVKHAKWKVPNASSLLDALQSADRIDWLGTMGIVGAAYFWTQNGMYGDDNPFKPEEKGVPRNFYQDAMRQTEWYAALPNDAIRAIADPVMPARIHFLRAFAAEAAARHMVKNPVENDLQRVLGPYYEKWRPQS